MNESRLPPKVSGKSEPQFMSMATDTYRAWNEPTGVWRSASGDMAVEDMADDHIKRVLFQIRERQTFFATLYVWGCAYLGGVDTALCDLFDQDPWLVLEQTPLIQALQQRTKDQDHG